MDVNSERSVFYISDGTAITAEVLGHAVLSQFPVGINSVTLPFVENVQRAQAVKGQINALYERSGVRPLVFISIVTPKSAKSFWRAKGFVRTLCSRWLRRFSKSWVLRLRRWRTALTG